MGFMCQGTLLLQQLIESFKSSAFMFEIPARLLSDETSPLAFLVQQNCPFFLF